MAEIGGALYSLIGSLGLILNAAAGSLNSFTQRRSAFELGSNWKG